MSAETREVIEAAMRLSPEQREIVVAVLSNALDEDDESVEEVEAAWLEETRRRLAEVRSGTVMPIPWAEAKQRLSRPRRAASRSSSQTWS